MLPLLYIPSLFYKVILRYFFPPEPSLSYDAKGIQSKYTAQKESQESGTLKSESNAKNELPSPISIFCHTKPSSSEDPISGDDDNNRPLTQSVDISKSEAELGTPDHSNLSDQPKGLTLADLLKPAILTSSDSSHKVIIALSESGSDSSGVEGFLSEIVSVQPLSSKLVIDQPFVNNSHIVIENDSDQEEPLPYLGVPPPAFQSAPNLLPDLKVTPNLPAVELIPNSFAQISPSSLAESLSSSSPDTELTGYSKGLSTESRGSLEQHECGAENQSLGFRKNVDIAVDVNDACDNKAAAVSCDDWSVGDEWGEVPAHTQSLTSQKREF